MLAVKSSRNLKDSSRIFASAALFALGSTVATAAVQPKPATDATKAANQAVKEELPFEDRQDFKNAQRGLIAKPDTLTIRDDEGNVVWDLEPYKQFIGLDKPAPDTVNPSLWRNAQLNMIHGLFKVTDGIYQVRSHDITNIIYVEGETAVSSPGMTNEFGIPDSGERSAQLA